MFDDLAQWDEDKQRAAVLGSSVLSLAVSYNSIFREWNVQGERERARKWEIFRFLSNSCQLFSVLSSHLLHSFALTLIQRPTLRNSFCPSPSPERDRTTASFSLSLARYPSSSFRQSLVRGCIKTFELFMFFRVADPQSQCGMQMHLLFYAPFECLMLTEEG